MPISLDEYPIHQAPYSLAMPATTDRNFYDRCYFNAHDRTGDSFFITGLGMYPNLGVRDAFVTIGQRGVQTTVRMSDALADDRLDQRVGPYLLEVVEPLKTIHLSCDADRSADQPIGFDLTWNGSFPPIDEPRHVMTRGTNVILDACRFAQVGTWEGEIRLNGETWTVDPATWLGTRDRSWGIRPVGEQAPGGRGDAEMSPDWGMWWVYCPIRFDDFALIVIAQEDGDGYRVLNDAVRVWDDPTRRPEQLGWPRVAVDYVAGTRMAERATISMTDAAGAPITVTVECLGHVALNAGPGYGPDPAWTHGSWRGRNWIDSGTVSLTDPGIEPLIPYATVDHVASARWIGPDGTADGWGMFEHMAIGAHPSMR